MATGISRKRWTNDEPTESGVAGSREVTLAYEGKRSEADILRTPGANVKVIYQQCATKQSTNRLFFGENLEVLSLLLKEPDVRRRVRLIYVDPPFATGSVFQSRNQRDAYRDLLAGAGYVEFIRERLILLRELLADDGSIYVHLDDKMAPYIKVVMDEVFGRTNFRNWITRKKCNPKNYTRNAFGNVTDYILFYSKSPTYVWNRPVEGWTAERSAKEYEYTDSATGRRYKKVPVHAPGERNGETGKPWRGRLPPRGKHWQFTPSKLDAFDARGLIYWSPNGNPRRKIFLDESAGVAVQDLWLEFRDAHNQNVKVSGYPTEKNPELLARIIEASSNKGDLVLDCFSGSGTTLAAAASLGRAWIGVDASLEAIETTLRRFAIGLKAMGDFVVRRSPEQQDPSGTLPLFRADEQTIVGDTHSELCAGTAIRDFRLFADDEGALQLGRPLEEWLRCLDQKR